MPLQQQQQLKQPWSSRSIVLVLPSTVGSADSQGGWRTFISLYITGNLPVQRKMLCEKCLLAPFARIHMHLCIWFVGRAEGGWMAVAPPEDVVG